MQRNLVICLLTALAALLLGGLPLRAQYRDDQFKRDAFSQNYDTTNSAKADSSKLFSFKEFFGGLGHKRTASLKTLTMGSFVFIGGNQIYNKQYWKLPIIYGGIGAGIFGGVYCNKLYNDTQDPKFKTFSTLSYVGAGLFYWGSLMDGAIMYDRSDKKSNPARATVYSLLLPGLGQIYNGEAWKVPIYWGLMAGSLHFVLDNNTQYQRWKWIHNQATTTEEVEERPPQTGEQAKYFRDMYRRWRDYSILALVISYALQVVDANVFAYMQGFEVSDDISLQIAPAVLPPFSQYALQPTSAPGNPLASTMPVGLRIGLTF